MDDVTPTTAGDQPDFDAVVIGAGFAGLGRRGSEGSAGGEADPT